MKTPSQPALETVILCDNIIAEGVFYPRGAPVPKHLVPERIQKACGGAQPRRQLPKDSPKLIREDGTVITDREEYDRAFQEREQEIMRHSGVAFYDPGQPTKVTEPIPEEERFYDTRHNQGIPQPSEKTLEAWRLAEGDRQ